MEHLPKVELHLHLDCSLSYEVVKLIRPGVSEAEYYHQFTGPPQCHDLSDYLERAQAGIELMQTEQNLILVTRDLFAQLKRDNIIYVEIRFAPFEHVKAGLKPEEVVSIVESTVAKCIKQFDIEARIILATLRHYPEEYSLKTIEMVEKFKGTTVVGFDIASDEAAFPIDNHLRAFQYAFDHHIPCTAHAGEAKGPESIRETLSYFKPQRIGHGVRCTEDPSLMHELKSNNIHLEICPTSNVQTRIYEKYDQHQIRKIYDFGISCSINTDSRAIANITLNEEYGKLIDYFDWTKEEFLKCNLEAMEHAFADEMTKAKIKRILQAAYAM